jgi:hypothetical protein
LPLEREIRQIGDGLLKWGFNFCHMQIDSNMIPSINLAYYKESDWKRFLESIDDKESMHDTWKDWHNAFLKTKKGFISQGFIVNDIVVEIDKLQDYCIMRGIKNDGKARSQFVANK